MRKYKFSDISVKSGVVSNGSISKVGTTATRKFSVYATKVLCATPTSVADFVKIINQFNADFATSGVKADKKEPEASSKLLAESKKAAFRVKAALVGAGVAKFNLYLERYSMMGLSVACVFRVDDTVGYAISVKDGVYVVGKCAEHGRPQSAEFLSHVKKFGSIDGAVLFLNKL